MNCNHFVGYQCCSLSLFGLPCHSMDTKLGLPGTFSISRKNNDAGTHPRYRRQPIK